MEGNSGSECSKRIPSKQNQAAESESEENDGESKPRNGGCSSNSTVEENEKKLSVRPYVRSKMPRLRWTPDLHLRFIHAVERLGGQDRATPKLVLQLMNIKGLSIAHVKSHLQMYRSKKNDDPAVISDHRHLVECGDRNIYNLSQLPMLHGYNNHHQGDSSTSFRCGASSWNRRECLTRNPFTSRSFIDEERPRILHETMTERIFGSNNGNWTNYNFRTATSPFNVLPSWKSQEVKNDFSTSHDIESFQTQPRFGPIELNPLRPTQAKVEDHTNFSRSGPSCLNKTNAQDFKAMKRKTSDCNLDLDLSLRLTQVDDESQRSSKEDDVGSDLSLSLYSQSPSKASRLKGENRSKESARRVSTLDLTI